VRQVVPAPVVAAPAAVAVAEPVAAAPPPPKPASPKQPRAARRAPRRSRGITVVSIAGLGVAAVLAYVVMTHGSQRTVVKREIVVHTITTVRTITVAPAASAPAPKPKAPHPRRGAAVHRAAASPHHVRLHVTARQTSWLEIRRGSSAGAIVYAGNLEGGRSVQADATRLWVRFASAGNVAVLVNGRPVVLSGTLERTFAPTRD
jgi:Domain of unknown function (DUF4115)